MSFFVVINEQGPSWVEGRPMRDQAMWTEHAAFVNSMMYDGFVVLGGPIGSGNPHRALLVISTESESTARERLEKDPWIRDGMLRIGSIDPWTILVSNDKLDPALAEITAPETAQEPRR